MKFHREWLYLYHYTSIVQFIIIAKHAGYISYLAIVPCQLFRDLKTFFSELSKIKPINCSLVPSLHSQLLFRTENKAGNEDWTASFLVGSSDDSPRAFVFACSPHVRRVGSTGRLLYSVMIIAPLQTYMYRG